MPLPIATQSTETPTDTTVALYALSRLGDMPTLSVSYAETVPDVLIGTITAVQDLDADGKFEALTVPEFAAVADRIVGTSLTLSAADIGTVASISGNVVMLTTPLASAPAVNTTISWHKYNHFGEAVSRLSAEGRQWSFRLSALDPNHRTRMASILGTVMFNAVKAGVTQLGLTATDADIQTAVHALAAQGTNIDSFITAQLEQLEADRRAGTFSLPDPFVSPMR